MDSILMDDPAYVTGSTVVQSGLTWAGLRYALTANVVGNWHPLTLVSHMLDCQLSGSTSGAIISPVSASTP